MDTTRWASVLEMRPDPRVTPQEIDLIRHSRTRWVVFLLALGLVLVYKDQ